jgi:hypothetical protein
MPTVNDIVENRTTNAMTKDNILWKYGFILISKNTEYSMDFV